MLLDALKEENSNGQGNEEIMRTLNDISTHQTDQTGTPPLTAAANANNSVKPSIAKTEKDKFNAKERRNSRYYVRSGDKEAIQCRANSLKRAINTVMEHSGLYDHKPKHGYVRDRKHSLASLNIPTTHGSTDALTSPRTSPVMPPPINIISPSSSETYLNLTDTVVDVLSSLSPLPDQRRSSMDEYFFNSLNLPVPKQFADAASRRSSGVPESIKEEESNGTSDTDETKLQETNTFKYESSLETEYKYDVGYLGLTSDSDGMELGRNCVPFEVYERNLLRSTQHNVVEIVQETDDDTCVAEKREVNTLQVPVLSMSEMESMERGPISQQTGENVYEGEKMTIIDTDPPVSESIDICSSLYYFILQDFVAVIKTCLLEFF